MDILEQLNTLKADFQAATDSKATLESTLAELNATVANKDEALRQASEALAAKESKVSELESALSAIQAKADELTAAQKTAEEKAIEIVANQGIPAPKVDVAKENVLTGADARAEYARLQKENPLKAGEYFASNLGHILRK